jgi:signal peptidase I
LKWLDTLQDWGGSLIVSFAIAIFLMVFFVQHIVVEGRSMVPTLQDGQHIVVLKLGHTLGQLPDYGKIVIVDSRVTRQRSLVDDLIEPINKWISKQEYVFIKRVIGRPGDELEIKDGAIYRNGTKLEEPYINEPMRKDYYEKIVVPANGVFVMGDNRNNSKDSRIIGPIPQDHVLGEMVIKIPMTPKFW